MTYEIPKCKDCKTNLILLHYIPKKFEVWFCPTCHLFTGKLLVTFEDCQKYQIMGLNQ
jgi:hypothetical protein